MKKIVFFIYLYVVLIAGIQITNAQYRTTDDILAQNVPSEIYETIDFVQFMSLVAHNNLGFLAAKFDMSIAEAMLRSERVFPDPELTVTFYENDEGIVLFGRGVEIELGYDLELGGKRRSRIRLAKSEVEMAGVLLDAALADLVAEAAVAFLETQKEMRLLELKQESYEAMRQLHRFDSIRFRLGEISEMEFLQTRLESASLRNEIFEQEAELKSSKAALNELAGRDPLLLLRPANPLSKPIEREYILGLLLDYALDDHVDLAIVMQQKQITRDELRLTRAERAMDLGLNLAYDIRAEDGYRQNFNTISVGVTVPLQFSNINRGGLRAAQFAVEQADMEYKAMELEVKRDISRAFFAYESLQRQVAQYENGMLDDAQRIFEGAMFAYRNGELRLLEVLIAQQTFNEVRENYIEMLFNYASSIVELNRVSGMWEVEF